MGNLKIKVVDGITPNFESTDSKDFIEILNKIAEAMGGVSNMGAFADITKVTQSNEMMADVSDQFISVTTTQYEKPHRDLQAISSETDPFQLELDCLIGKNGKTMPSDLESFLKKKDNPKESSKSAEKPLDDEEIDDEDDEDLDDENLEEENLEEEDLEEEDLEEEDEEEDDDDESISDAFKSVKKDIKKAFKFK